MIDVKPPRDLRDEFDPNPDPKVIIMIVGMPGAGKTTAAGYLARAGIRLFPVNEIIKDEIHRRGLTPGFESQLRVIEDIRKERGPAALAAMLEPRITAIDDNIIALDGLKSPEEIAYLEPNGQIFVLAIHASPATRLARLRARGYRDDPKTLEDLEKRDLAELQLGLGDVVARADGMIVNEHITKGELGALVIEFAHEWFSVGSLA